MGKRRDKRSQSLDAESPLDAQGRSRSQVLDAVEAGGVVLTPRAGNGSRLGGHHHHHHNGPKDGGKLPLPAGAVMYSRDMQLQQRYPP